MSTRTDWGLFRPDGSRLEPVAVGDEWWRWECPKKEYEEVFTEWPGGEITSEGYHAKQCPFKYVSTKREECAKCGIVFLYP